ncbi:hypothetical protein IGI04_013966 [Brassica rapa subsp. trilocularis]|uniref:Uncharacterized protein n=1 Tax=Brassica rapa subsp. trilocularis TaxID=1813537 RepID=A0ABQ7NAB6_BRACM|nr:hypothetical protein IGI04_013966 [Brassica rapa subsp. trilocularis]
MGPPIVVSLISSLVLSDIFYNFPKDLERSQNVDSHGDHQSPEDYDPANRTKFESIFGFYERKDLKIEKIINVARWNKVAEKYTFVLDLDDRFGYVYMPSLGHKNSSHEVNIHDRDTIAYTGIIGLMDQWKLDWDDRDHKHTMVD